MKLSIFVGDITYAPADALCTSTNSRLTLMMGTGASVRARGGPAVARACEALAPLPPGAARAPTAGALPHRIAIHCVASDANHRSSEAIVRSCVTNALACADAAGCATVAMPIFGSGHARYAFASSARAMALTALEASTRVREVKFVTNDDERVEELREILQNATGGRVEVERSAAEEPEPDSFWSDVYSLDVP